MLTPNDQWTSVNGAENRNWPQDHLKSKREYLRAQKAVA